MEETSIIDQLVVGEADQENKKMSKTDKTKKWSNYIIQFDNDSYIEEFKEHNEAIEELTQKLEDKLVNSTDYERDLIEGSYVAYMWKQLEYLKKDMRAIEKLYSMCVQQEWGDRLTGYLNSNICVWAFESTRFITRMYLRITNIVEDYWKDYTKYFESLIGWYKSKGRDDEIAFRYVRNMVSHYDSDFQYADEYKKFLNYNKQYMEDHKMDAIDRNKIASGLVESDESKNQIKILNVAIPIIACELLILNMEENIMGKEKRKLRELTMKKINFIIDVQEVDSLPEIEEYVKKTNS